MKKQFLLSFVFLLVIFQGISQKGTPTWSVTNNGSFGTCNYTVCLQIALRNISTQVISSSEWVCHSVSPGNTAFYSQTWPVSPAPGYEIAVVNATATYNTTTFTNMSMTIWNTDVRFGACSGGPSSNWVTMWERTGTYSFTIHEDLIVGMQAPE
ncbi:hypothetical protein [Fluviicola chungangensis]|uniref:Uncharacterized protein n=1 Tax=Fluviicola chungangensis TaxID=2597671 RepID=A0A556N2X8_9FLAO|nr:hypothetical protein [Fluviicola chungangensis]TSJ46557.1 hypothetical protein FO442_05200 [Fluviicola chungangensis]